MAKKFEPDGESDTRIRFDRGISELTGYEDGHGDGESPIIQSGYGCGDGKISDTRPRIRPQMSFKYISLK